MRNKGKKGKTSITSKLLNVMIAAALAFQPVFNSTGLFAITAKAEGEEPVTGSTPELFPIDVVNPNPKKDPVVTPEPTEQPVAEDPAPETPTDPDPETPTDPTPETPTDPDPETPTDPTPETPTDPTPETPTDPDPETPTDPDPETPAEPDLEGVMEITVEQPARNSNTFKFTIKVVKDGVYSYQYLVNNSKDSADWSTVTETEILPDGEKTEKDIIVENKENGTYYAHLRYWLGEDEYTEGTTTKELISDEVVVDVDDKNPVITVNDGEDIVINENGGSFKVNVNDDNYIDSVKITVDETVVVEESEMTADKKKSLTYEISAEDLAAYEVTDGTYTISVSAKDEFQNAGSAEAKLTIDTTKPEVEASDFTDQPENNADGYATLDIKFTEEVKNIKLVSSTEGGIEMTEAAGNSVSYKFGIAGKYVEYKGLTVSGEDVNGNKFEIKLDVDDFAVDKAAPKAVGFTEPPKDKRGRYIDKPPFYLFTFKDDSKVVNATAKRIWSGLFKEHEESISSKNISIIDNEDGTYTVKVTITPQFYGTLFITVTDQYGNVVTADSEEIDYDDTKPVVEIDQKNLTPNWKYERSFNVTIDDQETEYVSKGLDSYSWELKRITSTETVSDEDGNTTVKETYTVDAEGSKVFSDDVKKTTETLTFKAKDKDYHLDGSYRLFVTATDIEGNVSDVCVYPELTSEGLEFYDGEFTYSFNPEPEYDSEDNPTIYLNQSDSIGFTLNAGTGTNETKGPVEEYAYTIYNIYTDEEGKIQNVKIAEAISSSDLNAVTESFNLADYASELRDGIIELSFAATNMEGEATARFNYDDTAPEASIIYGENKQSRNEGNIFFYNADDAKNATIEIAVTDGNLDTVEAVVTNTVTEETETVELKAENSPIKYVGTFAAETDGVYTVRVYAVDKAGNVLDNVTENGGGYTEEYAGKASEGNYTANAIVVLDKIAPVVTVAYEDAIDEYKSEEDNPLYFGSKNTSGKISFTFEDTYPGVYDLNQDVVFLYRNNEQIWNDDEDHAVSYNALSLDDGEYVYDVLGDEERIGTTDRAGNIADVKEVINGGSVGAVTVGKIIVDKTAPVATVSFNPHHARVDGRDYYGAKEESIVATIKIDDLHFDSEKLKYGTNAAVIDEKTTYDVAVVDWKDPDQIIDVTDEEAKAGTITRTVSITDQGVYRVMIKGTDKANNNVVISSESKDMTVSNGGFWSNVKVLDKEISTEASVQNPNGFEYFKVNSVGVVTPEKPNVYRAEQYANVSMYAVGEKSPYKLNYEINSSTANKVTDAQEKFGFTNMNRELSGDQVFHIVSVTMEDLAGNIATIGEQTDIYLDTSNPNSDRSKPVASVKTSSAITARNADGRDLFGADVTLDLSVFDPNASVENPTSSGLKNVYYEVKADGVTVQSNTEADNNINNPKQYDWSRRITVTNDTNDIELVLYAYDNAGNISNTVTYKFAIDKTAPEITITYDNNDAQHEKYFKATRIATVRIEDRNIDVSKIHITTQGTQSGWSAPVANGSGVGNNDVRTCTITYATDGDYTLEVTGADAVDHTANVHYEGVAPRDFTIDKTAPVITVTFNNNDVRNGKYYKEARIATVSINEHNFLANEVNIATQQNIQRGTTASPAPSGFSNNGDIHNATMNYNQDGNFSFTVDYTDMAGNPAQTVNISEFVIDQTAPTVKFDEATVRENLATAGDIAPSAIFDDTNFSGDLVNFILTGARTNEHDVIFAKNFNQFGGTITYNDFAVVKENDDVYTLVATIEDLAGNKADAEVHFSVNRFGSTFDLNDDADTMALVAGYYAQQPGSVFVREINVNNLTEHSVTVNRDGTNILLKEGTDYKLTEMNWNGGKQYVYEIFASVFEKEGSYSITVQSVDSAGNINTNSSVHRNEGITDFPVRFAVDRTLPVNNITELAADRLNRIDAATKEFEADITDNMALSKIVITIDGNEVFNKEGKVLADYLKSNNGKVYFTADASGSPQTISIKSYDGAGNESETTEYRVLVSDNALVQYYYNTPLFVGSLGGLAAVIFGILIAAKRKKDNEGETAE